MTKQEQNEEFSYPVKTVKFRTCVELYKKWKVTKLRYKTAPSNGIEVEVEYADTLELINPELESNFTELTALATNSKIEFEDLKSIKCFPLDSEIGVDQNYKPLTALCLHGAPGCHKDYQHLIKYFIKRNVRVIAPKFPNYGLTKKTPFCHSPAEKAEYIKDFLHSIKVNRIDLLLCHSSGLFVAARLINDSFNAFGIEIEPEKCKKCKKSKKDKQCSKCEKAKQEETKSSDISESTDDEEDDDLFKDLDEKLKNLEKFKDEHEKKKEHRSDNDNEKTANKKSENKENNDLTDQKKESTDDKKQEEKKAIAKKSDEKKSIKKKDKKSSEKLNEKLNENPNEKLDEKEEVKQVGNNSKTLNEDEGYQEAFIDEQVNGKRKMARRQFSVSTISKSKLYFGSLILINVVPHKSTKLLNPVLKNSLYEPSAFFYQLKISRSLVRFCGKIYLDIFGSPVDYSNFDNTVLTLTTVLRSNVKSLREQLERITKTNLPILMFFSENDRLIKKGQSYELANFLNVNYIERDFSDASHHNYDVFNYNSKKKPIDKPEINNNNVNEVNQEAQIELQSTTSSDEFDSLRQIESESDTSSTKESSSSNEEGSIKSGKISENELRTDQTKELNSETVQLMNQTNVLNQLKYPYAVSIKKGRHYSHITHSHVMDEHIGKLITILNLKKN